jgi:hypothetical protein
MGRQRHAAVLLLPLPLPLPLPPVIHGGMTASRVDVSRVMRNTRALYINRFQS